MKTRKLFIMLIFFIFSLLFNLGFNTANSETETTILKNETESTSKWSGLTGFVEWHGTVSSAADVWLANGFTEWRELRDYRDTVYVNSSKAAVIAGNTRGLKAIWGVSSNPTVITAANWPSFRQAILDAARWAQDNGVFEFQIGNEEELHVDGTTITVNKLIVNLKSIATEVKKIFTRGNVSYSCARSYISHWVAAGKGDLDLLASNIYMGGNGRYNKNWKNDIKKLVRAFGVNGTYISEFAPSYSSLEGYSRDESEQAAAVKEMIEYMKDSGITRALFYSWKGKEFGALKEDGTYRLLWEQALLNSND